MSRELSEVEIVVRDGVPVVRVRGEIDLSNADAVLRSIEDAIDDEAPGLVVDLRELEFLDSAGVRLLFEAARLVTVGGGRFVALVGPGSPALRVLELAEATSLFPLETTEADAVSAASVGRRETQ